jgi:hypothetical protein
VFRIAAVCAKNLAGENGHFVSERVSATFRFFKLAHGLARLMLVHETHYLDGKLLLFRTHEHTYSFGPNPRPLKPRTGHPKTICLVYTRATRLLTMTRT